MAERRLKSWQVPPQATDEESRIGWINEATEDGLNWLRSQRGYGDYKKAMEVISGRPDPKEFMQYRSHLTTGRLKRSLREVIGATANIRPMWGYASDNQSYARHAEQMNLVTRAIYLEQFVDRSVKQALQYAAATCTGWMRPVYRRGMYGGGKGNFEVLTYGSPSVLPVQLPMSGDFQEAYAVTLLDEWPIAMAHGIFPDYAPRLNPTSSKYWYSADIRTAAKGNMFQRLFRGSGKSGSATQLPEVYVPIRYTWVLDLTINKTGNMIPMGGVGTSWYYEVPSVDSDIESGFDRNGESLYRKATKDDARLYPYRRLIISSEDVIMYDGPAFDWHGQLPLIPVTVDDWAWEPIGFSMVRDGFSIQQAINELERGVMDKHRAQLDMPLGYDINAVTSFEAKNFDPMQPRARLGFDGTMVDKPFQEVVPKDVLKVDGETMNFLEHLKETMDYQLAVNDMMALAKSRALGAQQDALDKFLEADGPIVRDISRSMERSLAKLGDQTKYIVIQYFTTRRIMQYVGPDQVTQETFDYDPNSLVPSHMPDEPMEDEDGNPKVSRYSRIQRARTFAENLRFFITPHTAHELTQMSRKLGLLQLRRSGIPIDSRTIAEAWDINYGSKPEGNTPYERYWNEKKDELEMMMSMKQMADYIGVPAAGAAGMAGQPLTPDGPGPGGGPQGTGGRPPSGQAAPKLETKDGGQRSTITES